MNIGKLTIGEYYKLLEVSDNPLEVLKFFGLNIDNMTIQEMNLKMSELGDLGYSIKPVSKTYYINGIKYNLIYNLTKIKAGQFIDFQSYMSGDKKLEQILSIFLIPCKKKFGLWKSQKYGDYDILKVQEDIRDYFKMEDAKTLSDFFLSLSVKSIQILKDCSAKRMSKELKKTAE